MGNEEFALKDRRLLLLFVCCIVFLVSGCETVKGSLQGAVNGAKKDWESLKTADERFRNALW